MPVRDEKYMQDQRQRIIEAAFRCISKLGFQKTSVRTICNEANLAVGTLYIHFKDKTEILSAMTLMAYGEPMDQMEFESWDDFNKFLLSSSDIKTDSTMLQFFLTDLSLAAEAQDNKELAELLSANDQKIYEWMKSRLSQFVDQGEIELPLGLDVTARSLRYLMSGVGIHQLFDNALDAEAFSKTLGILVIVRKDAGTVAAKQSDVSVA
jgi:AcrR family transcriptional regulator